MASSEPTNADPPLYREEQRFRQVWLWLLVMAPAMLVWWPFIEQVIGGRPVGDNPAPDWAVWVLWVLFGIGLPFLFGRVKMVTEVTSTEVLIHYRPFSRRRIPHTDIRQIEARTYNAMKEYGGWGIKGWSKEKMVYNVSGNRGVELTLADGRKLMLGSQRSDELAAAIDGQLRLLRRPVRRSG
jgi:Family of unknown function (DUF6141)